MKSIPIVTLQCACDMLHNRMEMLNCYVTDEKRTLWIRLKNVLDFKTAGGGGGGGGSVRCFWNYLTFLKW